MELIRSMRGGKDYDAAWHQRQRGTGVYAQVIAKRFAVATRRYGLVRRSWEFELDAFTPPPRAGDQMVLL